MGFDVTVSGEDIDSALKQIKKFNKGKKPFDLILEFDGTSLLLGTPLVTLPIPATGCADVKICLPGRVMVNMIGLFPPVLCFTLVDKSLKVDRLTMPCSLLD